MRHIEKKKPLSRWHVEKFLYQWSENFASHLQFILSHYDETQCLLDAALDHALPKRETSRTSYLVRHENLSLCLNHFEKVVTPLHLQTDDRAIKMVRNSNQRLLSRWDTRTCLPETAVASKVVAINSPGRKDTFLIL